MAIPHAYVRTTTKLKELLGKLPTAGVPERFTLEFLKTLGFRSSNDRMAIQVLKAIGFLDSNGTPTPSYRAFRNPKEGPYILANALRESYSDLFMADTNADELSIDALKGVVATKVDKGESVVADIARTFKAMAELADFTQTVPVQEEADQCVVDGPTATPEQVEVPTRVRASSPSFHYNIEIHLPTTTDISVYNAIFKSLRENLL